MNSSTLLQGSSTKKTDIWYWNKCIFSKSPNQCFSDYFGFQMEFVEYLLKNSSQLGIDVNHCDQDGNNALVYAVSNGNYTMFQKLYNAG